MPVTVTATEDGPVTIAAPAGALANPAGNVTQAAAELILTADVSAPSVAITAPDVTGGAVNGAFDVTFTFSEPVIGFEAGDVQLVNAALSDFAGVGGPVKATPGRAVAGGTVFTARITPGTPGVPVQLSIDAAWRRVRTETRTSPRRASRSIST